MAMEEMPFGSAFYFSSEHGGGPALSAWGRVEIDGFEGEQDAGRLDGDTTTGLVGVDVEAARMLAGITVSVSEGSGGFRPASENGSEPGSEDIESSLVGVYPYARLRVSERVSLWGARGLRDRAIHAHP